MQLSQYLQLILCRIKCEKVAFPISIHQALMGYTLQFTYQIIRIVQNLQLFQVDYNQEFRKSLQIYNSYKLFSNDQNQLQQPYNFLNLNYLIRCFQVQYHSGKHFFHVKFQSSQQLIQTVSKLNIYILFLFNSKLILLIMNLQMEISVPSYYHQIKLALRKNFIVLQQFHFLELFHKIVSLLHNHFRIQISSQNKHSTLLRIQIPRLQLILHKIQLYPLPLVPSFNAFIILLIMNFQFKIDKQIQRNYFLY
ncbi:transmembrane protein, putative (macronuclear) [Tetrahymena thermophila SB210]|uniref:Transmembrane protein, putative n=1 Tax=Tetrahymena thermophila (strain SB210) TaxID=312017 RepID=W7XA80_TETTS|nr:transmembrane protein, putative [Tetrahymena thermophila SB210]EWS74257.1 transmembrane protein, putative [Tetrahymena thermophila SB210]|eukprot:XP_012653230.1 transmembrane protein, putative [Tetrahymena thermophila SB210]